MLTKYLVLSVFLFGTWAQAVSPKVYEEKNLQYLDIKDGKTTWVQTATEFFPIASAAKIPGFVDLYETTKNKVGIRSYVVVRSSFYLPLSLDVIRTRMSNPKGLSDYSQNLKIQSCNQTQCQAEIKTTFADLPLNVAYGVVDKKNASGNWISVFTSLHNPEFLSVQKFTEIESVFMQGSSFSAFYPMSANLTWVQSYQIFSIKSSAYDKAAFIPFFNLEKNIRSVIRTLLLDARSSILQEQKYTMLSFNNRMPAASGYDSDLYLQKSYKLFDTEGDEALIERAEKVPFNVLKALFEEENFSHADDPWLPEPWETVDPLAGKMAQPLHAPGPSIQGRDKPIDIERFSEMLDQVLLEETQRGLKPFVGLFHEWSMETRQKYEGRSAVLGFSKLFICLSLGFSNRFMKTGKERDLWNWMMEQDYNSITFPELFRASYRLHRGDVYLALLTVENLLSANWRYTKRETLPATKRLRPITSGYNYDGDRFGTWYHFFGMILYGYRTGSGMKSNIVGRIEALGSNVLSPTLDQTQKQWFNKLGGYIGDDLKESVLTGRYLKRPSRPHVLAEPYYLNRSEDFRDRLPLKSSPDLQVKVRDAFGGADSVYVQVRNNSNEDLVGCKVDVFVNNGTGYYAPAKISRDDVTIKANRKFELNVSGSEKRWKPRAVRVFVEQCQQGSSRAAEWKN
ncbi:hypothetical protein [Bdellovibrio sp. HCB337]|uniref:hypothetical protein n=1 Tax=Bdellovibrio sp. HCB337 TaxID=3394358 RepID=UPI0039A538D2